MPQHVSEFPEQGPGPRIGACRLEIAARLERRTHAAGIAWRLTIDGNALPTRSRTLHRASTLMGAELTAARDGIRDAVKAGCRVLLVNLPDPRLVALLGGGPSRRLPRVQATVERMKARFGSFASVRFDARFAPDPTLAHAVGEALDAGLRAAVLREEHRVDAMERVIARARGVKLRWTDSGWVANDRYHVQFNPMHCECPAWAVRWANAPLGARRAQRLPCKHLVALALHEGFSVPADLAELARRAPA